MTDWNIQIQVHICYLEKPGRSSLPKDLESLILLPNAGKLLVDLPVLGPICLLDTSSSVCQSTPRTSNQFGFRQGRSTIDFILSDPKTAEIAFQHKGIFYCAQHSIQVNQKARSRISDICYACYTWGLMVMVFLFSYPASKLCCCVER